MAQNGPPWRSGRFRSLACRTVRAVLACCWVLTLFAAGCENSEHPASDPENAEPVPGLHGVWKTRWSDDEVQFLHVGAAGGRLPDSMLRVELVTHRQDGELVTHDQLMVAIPGGTQERPLLSAAAMDRDAFGTMHREGWTPDAVGDYFLYAFRLEENRLLLRGIDRKEQRRLIEEGATDGRIMEPEGRFTWVRIRWTAPTERLAGFLASPEAGDLFETREQAFERVSGGPF